VSIKSPFYFMGKVLGLLWWPFSFVFWLGFRCVIRSDRAWNWFIRKVDHDPEVTAKLQAARLQLLTGGFVSMVAVEKSQPDQAEKQSEAKPS
jgi:hypothetical protein